jgi:hypothetical protein
LPLYEPLYCQGGFLRVYACGCDCDCDCHVRSRVRVSSGLHQRHTGHVWARNVCCCWLGGVHKLSPRHVQRRRPSLCSDYRYTMHRLVVGLRSVVVRWWVCYVVLQSPQQQCWFVAPPAPPAAPPPPVLHCRVPVRLCHYQHCAWDRVMRGAMATRLGYQTPIARACVHPASTALLGLRSACCALRGTRVTPDPRRPPSSCASGATTVLQAPLPPRGTSVTRAICVQKVAVQARHHRRPIPPSREHCLQWCRQAGNKLEPSSISHPDADVVLPSRARTGSALTPSDPISACFASGSVVAAWSWDPVSVSLTLVSHTTGFGTLGISGLRSGFDVQCNGVAGTARLPRGVSTIGLLSAALVDVSGSDGMVDLVAVLANGSTVVASNNGSNYFLTSTVGLPPVSMCASSRQRAVLAEVRCIVTVYCGKWLGLCVGQRALHCTTPTLGQL